MNTVTLALLLVNLIAINAETVPLHGIGGNFIWPLYSDWSYAYSLVNTKVSINYTATTWTERSTFLKGNSTSTDFYSPNALLTRHDAELIGEENNLQLIPLTIGSIVPIYNVLLSYADGSEGTPQLVLSTKVLADIFRGRITDWNDTRIADDNPKGPITKVLHKSDSGFAYTFQYALSKFVGWNYPIRTTWPLNITSTPYTIQSTSDFGIFSLVSSRINSIGYVPYSQLVTQRIALPSTYALLINEQGQIVGPEQEFLLAAQENQSFDDHMFGNFINSNNTNSYPITLNSYIAYRIDKPLDCLHLRELFKFIYWTKTDADALKRPSELGYSHFSDDLRDKIISFLNSTQCEGKPLLYVEIVPQHQSAAYIFYLVLALILLGISLFLGGVWQYLNISRCNKVVVLYQAILLLGVCLTYLSVIFFYLVPSVTYICQLRIWLATIGYSLILTAMFERTWQIKRVYGKVLKGSNLASGVTSILEVGGGILIILSIQLVILLVWTTVNINQSVVKSTGNIWEGEYACTGTNPAIWILLELLYFAVLLIWAIHAVYSTWSIKTYIVESRWILIAMYNIILFLALLCTLYATVKNINDDILVGITVPFILLSTTTVVVAVYSPSILKELKLVITSNSHSTGQERSLSRSKTSKHEEMSVTVQDGEKDPSSDLYRAADTSNV